MKAGDVVETVPESKANGLRQGRYTLIQKHSYRTWEARHESADYTVDVYEDEIQPVTTRRKRS